MPSGGPPASSIWPRSSCNRCGLTSVNRTTRTCMAPSLSMSLTGRAYPRSAATAIGSGHELSGDSTGRVRVDHAAARARRAGPARGRAERAARRFARARERVALRAGCEGSPASAPDPGGDLRRAFRLAVDVRGRAARARGRAHQWRDQRAGGDATAEREPRRREPLVYAYGYPPEETNAELLDPAV